MKLNKVFWMLLINSMFIYGAIEAFTNVGNDYIQDTFGFSQNTAGNILTIYYIISMLTTPFFGYITDKYGHRMKLLFIAALLLVTGNVIMIVLPDCNQCYTILISICILGVFNGMYAATFWACPSLIVEQKALGTAFGLLFSAQNLSAALVPLVVGEIEDYGYIYVSVLALGIAIVATLTGIVAEVFDRKGGRKLEKVYIQQK